MITHGRMLQSVAYSNSGIVIWGQSIKPLACQSRHLSSAPLVCLWSEVAYIIANIMDPDQTAPQGAV